MTFIEFKESMKIFPIFSYPDIRKRYPSFDRRRLVEWQDKGQIVKIRSGYYHFSDSQINEKFLFFAANKIYAPSYISLESAFQYYNFIPEGVFMFTSVTSRNTAKYEASLGSFSYQHVKPNLYFGYKLIDNEYAIRVAEPEKAILDFFYLKNLNTLSSIKELRLNAQSIKEVVDMNKLNEYLEVFQSSTLVKRINYFKKAINA
ncbi:MAG: hypothetical protein MRY83_17100 [Flavobacteriales bacterium]|nr:hypothetical protein [Flavobacteriales bacterium]